MIRGFVRDLRGYSLAFEKLADEIDAILEKAARFKSFSRRPHVLGVFIDAKEEETNYQPPVWDVIHGEWVQVMTLQEIFHGCKVAVPERIPEWLQWRIDKVEGLDLFHVTFEFYTPVTSFYNKLDTTARDNLRVEALMSYAELKKQQREREMILKGIVF